MMIAALSVVLLFLHSVIGTKLNVVRQDGSSYGTIERYENGKVTATSNVKAYPFSWPLVEMTHNTKSQEVYIITYPDNAPGAVLYLLDSDLQLKFTWDSVAYSYFDLQYSSKQDSLFGIYVSSSYGRVFSRFDVNKSNSSDIAFTQLFTMPYMWYVNASTYQQSTDTYYALLNYFPGKEGYTSDQQLFVSTFSTGSMYYTKIVPSAEVKQPVAVQFLGYSEAAKELYFAGMYANSSTAIVGTLDLNGQVKNVLWEKTASAVGPLVVDDASKVVTVYTEDTENKKWSLWSLSQKKLKESLVKEYKVNDHLKVFAAATIAV